MKILTRHQHWFVQIHCPIVAFIAIIWLSNPGPLLHIISSPVLWAMILTLRLFYTPYSPENSSQDTIHHLPSLWRIIMMTWCWQLALLSGLKALHFFTVHGFVHTNIPAKTLIEWSFPWFAYAAIAISFRYLNIKTGNLKPHLISLRFFSNETTQLCYNQWAKITLTLSQLFILLPLVLMFAYLEFSELHYGTRMHPLVNTIMFLIPLFWLKRSIPWEKYTRQLIYKGFPIWIICCALLIPMVTLIMLAQPILDQLFILKWLIPDPLMHIITTTPWPDLVLRHSQDAFTTLWWMAWSLPSAALLLQLYQGRPTWQLLAVIGLGQIGLSPLTQHPVSGALACWLALLSSVILMMLFLHQKATMAFLTAELPSHGPLKFRNPARQVIALCFSLLLALLFMLAFGLEWLSWIMLTASMPFIILMIISLSIPPRSQ